MTEDELKYVQEVIKCDGYVVTKWQPRRKRRTKHPDVARQPAYMSYEYVKGVTGSRCRQVFHQGSVHTFVQSREAY